MNETKPISTLSWLQDPAERRETCNMSKGLEGKSASCEEVCLSVDCRELWFLMHPDCGQASESWVYVFILRQQGRVCKAVVVLTSSLHVLSGKLVDKVRVKL